MSNICLVSLDYRFVVSFIFPKLSWRYEVIYRLLTLTTENAYFLLRNSNLLLSNTREQQYGVIDNACLSKINYQRHLMTVLICLY